MQQQIARSGDRYVEMLEREQVRTASVTREGAEYRRVSVGRARRDMEGAMLGRGREPVRFCFPGSQ